VNEIGKGGRKGNRVQADVAKKKDIETSFTETRKAFGRLDILVNMLACTASHRSE